MTLSLPGDDGFCDRRNVVVLTAIMLLALALRWPQMTDSLWLDELHTAWTVDGSWSEVFARARIGNQSPPYFWLVKASRDLFGASDWSLRGPSLLAGMGLVLVAGWLTQRWSNSLAAGWFAATLIAIDRNWIFYSQEARPYALLQLVAWCHAGVAVELARRNANWLRVAFVVGAVVQFYLHYTATLFIAAEVVFLLFTVWRGGSAYSPRRLACDLLIVAVACLPAAWHLVEIAGRRAQWQSLFSLAGTSFVVSFGLPSFAVVAFCLFIARRVFDMPRTEWPVGNVPHGRRLTWIAMVLPLAAAWCATTIGVASLFSARYLVAPLVGAAMWSAIAWLEFPNRWARTAIAVMAMGITIFTSGMVVQFRHDGRLIGDRVQNWRGAVAFVNQHADPARDVVFVRSGFLEADLLLFPHDSLLEEYCLAPVNSLYRLGMKARPLPITDAQIELGAGTTWILFNGLPSSRRRFFQDIVVPSSAKLFVTEFGEVSVIRWQPAAESR